VSFSALARQFLPGYFQSPLPGLVPCVSNPMTRMQNMQRIYHIGSNLLIVPSRKVINHGIPFSEYVKPEGWPSRNRQFDGEAVA
jgi:hypothetical protein